MENQWLMGRCVFRNTLITEESGLLFEPLFLSGTTMNDSQLLYDGLIVKFFWWCVELLNVAANQFDMSYEALNIWVFVIFHPSLTALVLCLYLRERYLLLKIQSDSLERRPAPPR